MTDNTDQPEESLITFPCDFTIKVFGYGTDEFEAAVLMIVHKHATNLADRLIQSRPSKNGKYRALSITIHVTSKAQLDDIYRELSSSKDVLMAL